MASYLIDSSILIDLSRKFSTAKIWIDQFEIGDLVISFVSVAELLSGCRNKREQERVEADLVDYPILWATQEAQMQAIALLGQFRLSNGIGFLDEIDQICARSERSGADVSREGVQRDLLPLIEGTTVSTKHGPVKTDHVLFIASGAFHIAKPSDLLPELQGRLPIRVELKALTQDDFKRILIEPEASIIKQYKALMLTEGVTLDVTEDGVAELARVAAEINSTIENIGARRLQTVMERVLDDVSFTATDRAGETVLIDAAFVQKHVSGLAKNADLSKFIL